MSRLLTFNLLTFASILLKANLDHYNYYAIFLRMILRKSFIFVSTICRIIRLKCTKFDFGWVSAPDPTGEAHSATPDPLAGFEGQGRGRDGKGKGKKGRGRDRERRETNRGRERKGKEEREGERGGRESAGRIWNRAGIDETLKTLH